MSRQKRTSSRTIRYAATRAAGLESIDPALDLGNGMTLAMYKAEIAQAMARQSTYNTLLAQTDEAKSLFDESEAWIADLTSRMLAAVAAKYGRASNEYEQAGGRKKKTSRRRALSVEELAPEAKAA